MIHSYITDIYINDLPCITAHLESTMEPKHSLELQHEWVRLNGFNGLNEAKLLLAERGKVNVLVL